MGGVFLISYRKKKFLMNFLIHDNYQVINSNE